MQGAKKHVLPGALRLVLTFKEALLCRHVRRQRLNVILQGHTPWLLCLFVPLGCTYQLRWCPWPSRKAATHSQLYHVCVKTIILVDRIGMLRPDCSGGETMPCTFLAHHERESVLVMITADHVQH